MRFLSDNPSERDLSAKRGLRVIAAGLPRCATSSLQSALETNLDCSPCMHMAYIAPHTSQLKLCHAALCEPDKAKRQKLLHAVFDGYQATADFPGMVFVDDLLEMYPDAKVILNQRDSGVRWLRSITGTLQFFSTWRYLAVCCLWSTDRWHWRVHQAARLFWNRRFGIEDQGRSIFVLDSYENHKRWVRDVAKRSGSQVLEWRPEQGWGPICEFLGKDVPQVPFPRLNDENTIKMVTAVLLLRGLLSWAVVLASPALLYWTWLRFSIA